MSKARVLQQERVVLTRRCSSNKDYEDKIVIRIKHRNLPVNTYAVLEYYGKK